MWPSRDAFDRRSFTVPGQPTVLADSITRGDAPVWSRDGRELFFVSSGADMMSARVNAGAPIMIAAPTLLFHIADDLLKVEYAYYTPRDVAADGRFIMARARAGTKGTATSVVIAEHWLTELHARMKR